MTAVDVGAMPLFLLPSAGGSAGMFAAWEQLADRTGVVASPVELPGRGTRISERPLDDVPALLDLLVALTPTAGAWAVLGHSFGALLAVEWAAAAERLGRGPRVVVVSGAAPPWVHSTAAALDGPVADIWERVAALGGIPEAVAASPVARRVLGRAMAADVRAAAQYRPVGPIRVACDLVVVQGRDDPIVSAAHGAAWSAAAGGAFEHHVIAGGHFYRDGIDDLMPLVTQVLTGSDTHPRDPACVSNH